MQQMLRSLSDKGYAIIESGSEELLDAISARLGRTILRTDVRVNPSQRAAVFSAEPIEWHQDSTEARWMAWLCKHPGEVGAGSTEILPLDRVLNDLSTEQRRELSKVKVLDRLADGSEVLRPLLSGRYLYYCPWLIQPELSMSERKAMVALKDQIEKMVAEAHRQIWRRDQIVIVDNHRCLHRRPRLNPRAERHLIRLWIAELS